MPKAKKRRVEQPEQPEAEEDEGSIEEEDPESEPEPEVRRSPCRLRQLCHAAQSTGRSCLRRCARRL